MRSASIRIEPGSSASLRAGTIGNTMPLRIRVVTAPAFRRPGNLSTRAGCVHAAVTSCAITLRPMVVARHPLLRALEPVADALCAQLVGPKHVRAGDVPLEWEGELVGGLRLPGMQGTLERMM